MQCNRVEEVQGINDKYNPLPLSIEYGKDERGATILMREETHTIGNLVKERLLRRAGEVESIGCGMVHPHDIKILQLQLRTARGARTADELLLEALAGVREEACEIREAWRAACGGST